MAARTHKIQHDDQTRAKIKASQLINRLTDHVLGDVEMTATQVRAAEVLLRKALPDLSAVSAPDGGAIGLNVRFVLEAGPNAA